MLFMLFLGIIIGLGLALGAHIIMDRENGEN